MDGMRGLDAWITGGRYSEEILDVTCPECEEVTVITATTDYGATEWSKTECDSCHAEFPDDVEYGEAEPPEPDPYEDRY